MGDHPRVAKFKDDILFEPDIRASDFDEDDQNNFILQDGKFHGILKQSKDDCFTSHNRYLIRNRRRKGDHPNSLFKD